MEDRTIEGMTDHNAVEIAQEDLDQLLGEKITTEDGTLISDAAIVETLSIPYKMTDNYVLIKPLKPENIKKRVEVLDEKKNKGKMPQEVMETKRVTKSVQTDYRTGVVLDKGPNMPTMTGTIEIGDTVVFHKSMVERSWFDLFKDSLILRSYDIVAIKKDA